MVKPFRRPRPKLNPLFFQNRTLASSSGSSDLSTLATKVSLGNLATRVSSLETLGISGISNAVSWTNLTEINVGDQTITSGGTVQAYAGGGLEKISGASGYNSGGFSVNYIPGNSDGYFQFQLAQLLLTEVTCILM